MDHAEGIKPGYKKLDILEEKQKEFTMGVINYTRRSDPMALKSEKLPIYEEGATIGDLIGFTLTNFSEKIFEYSLSLFWFDPNTYLFAL
jgi:hypothetical protein